MSGPGSKAPALCGCEWPRVTWRQGTYDVLYCEVCGAPPRCEICDLEGAEPPVPATHLHVDYVVCEGHLGVAIDNVSSRGGDQ